jgi:hypothetical protein
VKTSHKHVRVYTNDGPGWVVSHRVETRWPAGKPRQQIWLLVEFADGHRRWYDGHTVTEAKPRLVVDEEGRRQ